MSEAQDVIDVALKEVGYIEKKSNSQLDDKTANAGVNNYTKYARDLDNLKDFYNTPKNGYDWCDVFVDWCFYKALGEKRAMELLNQPKKSTGAGCGFSMEFYKKEGQLFKTPKAGDQIFFVNGNSVYHTGLVYKVDSSKVYTIEGNSKPSTGVVANGGQVCKKSYSLKASYIGGYGRPKYKSDDVKPEPKPTPTPAPKTEKPILEWQKVMNRVYNCGLEEDNSYGPDSRAKANNYYLYYSLFKKTIVNDHVKFIQNRLIKKGYSCGKKGADRSYGPDTKKAVKAFQKANGLKVDGQVGADTTAKLLK